MESLQGSVFQLEHSDYDDLLHLSEGGRPSQALQSLLQRARQCDNLLALVEPLMADGWRAELVGALAGWVRPEPGFLELLWLAFDRGSWAAPQLAVIAWSCDPDFEARARRRLLLGCPLLPHPRYSGEEPADPRRAAKNRAVLMALLSHEESGRQWLQQRITLEEAVQVLLIDDWDGAPGIVAQWSRGWQYHLEALGERLERRLEVKGDLLRLWPLDAPNWLLQGNLMEDLFAPLLRAGAQRVELRPEHGGDVVLSDTGATVRLPAPWHRLFRHIVAQQSDWFYLDGRYLLRSGSLEVGQHCSWQELSRKELRIRLTRLPLQDVQAEVLAYGTDDSGLLDSGAGAALLELAGSELQEDVRSQLFEQERDIGSVVITPAYGLSSRGVRRVCHILSLSRAARCCPYPENLGGAVEACLEHCARGISSLAMTSLATGGGGARVDDVAQMMVGRVLEYFQRHPHSQLRVTFSLPHRRDFQAFERALAACPC